MHVAHFEIGNGCTWASTRLALQTRKRFRQTRTGADDPALLPRETAQVLLGDIGPPRLLHRQPCLARTRFSHRASGPSAVDYAFQQRIAGQPVSAVDSGACSFAGSVQPF